MGQIHQHLVLLITYRSGLKVFLEYIPHLKDHFEFPARVEGGVYQVPDEVGASCEFRLIESDLVRLMLVSVGRCKN